MDGSTILNLPAGGAPTPFRIAPEQAQTHLSAIEPVRAHRLSAPPPCAGKGAARPDGKPHENGQAPHTQPFAARECPRGWRPAPDDWRPLREAIARGSRDRPGDPRLRGAPGSIEIKPGQPNGPTIRRLRVRWLTCRARPCRRKTKMRCPLHFLCITVGETHWCRTSSPHIDPQPAVGYEAPPPARRWASTAVSNRSCCTARRRLTSPGAAA